MKLRTLLTVSIATVIGASAAHAEGAHVEVHGGYDRLAHPGFFSPSDNTFKPIESAVYGIGAGYDIAISKQAFAGIATSADFSGKTRCQVNPLIASVAPGIFESCLRPGRDLSVVGRIGVSLGDNRTRVYALAGYSNLRLTELNQYNRQPPNKVGSETKDGVRIGAGIETSVSGSIYAKAEYRHSNYASNVSRNQGIIGIGLRF